MSVATYVNDRPDRLYVQSADATSLAVWIEGEGPPLVMVHGSLTDHSTFDALVGELRVATTTLCMDRRGFGASGDADGYSIEREFEDVAAVVDAVAAKTGAPVALLGHSYGANCAMGGAALSDSVHHLVLYEPSLGMPGPAGSIEAIERALAAGNREAAILAVLIDSLEMTEEEVDALRASPRWPTLLAGAHTVPREGRTEESWEYRPRHFEGIACPTLMLVGSESPLAFTEATQRAAAAIPNARLRTLVGHGHLAHRTDPSLVAAIVQEFISS